MSALARKVAIVTGASRGVGRGVALALADQGATVYLTGRTTASGSHALPGTLQDAVREIEERNGKAIAVQVDHGSDTQVVALFDRVVEEQGRLDILVNNAFALPDTLTDAGSFWEKPLSDWQMVDVGVRSTYVAARCAAQIMAPQRSGLIVSTSGYTGVTYTYGVIFGMCKTAVDRMARDMAVELKPHNVASLSLWLGLTFTERAARALKMNPDMTAETVTDPMVGSSPEFPGRVIAELAKAQDLMARTGGTYIAAELAREFGVTDLDGSQPPSLRETRGAPIFGPV